MRFIVLAAFIVFSEATLLAQDSLKTIDDSTELKIQKHSPTMAAIFSALVPGLGQAYNKKYWKIPIIYTGFGVLGYFVYTNADRYDSYQQAYHFRVDGDSLTVDEFVNDYSDADLLTLKKYYRRNLEISIIGTTVLYLLNIIDATVDAHLFYFDVSDDLSLRLEPYYYFSPQQKLFTGLSLKFDL